MPSEAYLRKEGELYGIDPDHYHRLSPILRSSAKSTWMKDRRIEAADKGLDVEAYLQEKTREIQTTLAREFPGEGGVAAPAAAAPASVPFGTPPGGGMPTPRDLFGGGSLPRRSAPLGPAPTLGDPNAIPDLVGDGHPRTLADIYARWPVGKNSDYYIRVERIQPKSFQGMACAGYIGDVHVELSEHEFGAAFGGRDYLLTVYGPDPRKKEEGGVKALSQAVRVSIPILPPNLAATSIFQKGSSNMQGYPQFPGQMPFGMAQPPSQAEATMHKNTLDMLGGMIKMEREEKARIAQQGNQASEGVLRFVADQNKSSTELLRDQLNRAEQERLRVQEELGKLQAAAQVATKSSSGDTVALIQALSPNKDDQLKRIEMMHLQQMESARQAHESVMQTMRERHDSEIKRSEERLKDTITNFVRDIESLRSAKQQSEETMRRDFESRERQLRDEVATIRREMREESDKRVAELKERYADQIKDIERSQERELRAIKESADTKLHVTGTMGASEVNQLKERLAELQVEIGRLRDENARLSDPVQQIQAAEEQAQRLGYTKEDPSAPKTAIEHLASTVGTGIGQALGSAHEWVPALLQTMQAGRMQQPMMQPQLPPGAVPQLPPGAAPQLPPGAPQAAPPPQPRRRAAAVQWATENSSLPVAPVVNPTLGFQGSEPVQPQVAQVAPSPDNAAPAAAPAPAPQAAPQPGPGGLTMEQMEAALEQELPALPAALTGFTKFQVYSFVAEVEKQIKTNTNPTVFADMFGGAYPDDAGRVSRVPAKAIIEYVNSWPGAQDAEVLSRGGKQWLERLERALKKKFPA